MPTNPQLSVEECARLVLAYVTKHCGFFDKDFQGAEIESLIRRVLPQWEPMETAPKDGTRILVNFGDSGVHAVAWEEANNCSVPIWCVDDRKHGPYMLRGYNESDVKGWQPLPSAPKESNDGM